ncbi:MAG: FAD-dependent oxidoreductase [bacterium]|nr:FAD-dependent oxidoreductase [bacterium]
MTDLVIVGAGPSGLSAAIYAARDGLNVRVFEKAAVGGLIATSDWVENYPGFEDGISGVELSKKMRAQAEKFGAIIDYGEVSEIQDLGDKVRMLVDDEPFEARKMLLAVGNSYRKLGLPREEEFIGRGIHFCATCDGAFYAGKTVIAVGGGDSAVQDALFLARFAKVKLLVRSKIRAQEILQKRLEKAVAEGKIEVFLASEIEEILTQKSQNGEKISGVRVRQRLGDQIHFFEIEAAAIFEFIGLIPQTKFLQETPVVLNQFGEIQVNAKFQTSAENIFASGDAIENAEKQLVVAAASGAQAAMEISKIIDKTN